jgi:1-aminocyclopropane-1-carboxylate deaminase
MIVFPTNVIVNKLENEFLLANKVELYLQREDLIHPEISGNKWRKLKYNLKAYSESKCDKLLTFGGAFSNHIAATAAAGKIFNIPTIGVIRGEKSSENNATLKLAKENGMELFFIDRNEYQNKSKDVFIDFIQHKFPNSFLIPEGGANLFGILGCREITQVYPDFDSVICACGTGATLAGIIAELKPHQKAIGIPVLKNANFLVQDIQQFLNSMKITNQNWEINCEYHLGGYAKNNLTLNQFIEGFYQEHQIKLEPIYTGKMMFAIYDLIKNGSLKNKRILAIHTGGLQGIKGYESRYKIKLFD